MKVRAIFRTGAGIVGQLTAFANPFPTRKHTAFRTRDPTIMNISLSMSKMQAVMTSAIALALFFPCLIQAEEIDALSQFKLHAREKDKCRLTPIDEGYLLEVDEGGQAIMAFQQEADSPRVGTVIKFTVTIRVESQTPKEITMRYGCRRKDGENITVNNKYKVTRKHHPNTSVVCISPTWAPNTKSRKSGLSLDSFRQEVAAIVAARRNGGDENIHLARGEKLTSEKNNGVHFSVEGAAMFARDLHAELTGQGVLE